MEGSFDSNFITNSVQLTIWDGLGILFSALIAGITLRYIFKRFSTTFSSKSEFGNTLLIITISVASLIAVVKSSLALSLGLVGALSVIRYRTAVKEPFNLAFILLSICIGISIGASQYIFALLVLIIGAIAVVYCYSNSGKRERFFKKGSPDFDSMILNLPSGESLKVFYELLKESTEFYAVQSLQENENGIISISLKLKLYDLENLEELRSKIKKTFPNSEFTFFSSPNI